MLIIEVLEFRHKDTDQTTVRLGIDAPSDVEILLDNAKNKEPKVRR